MHTQWDLSVFYSGFDDPAFAADLARLPDAAAELSALLSRPADNEADKLRTFISGLEKLSMLSERLQLMVMLTLSVDAGHKEANAAMASLQRACVRIEQLYTAFSRHVASLGNLRELIESDDMLRANAFMLLEAADKAEHQLPEALEGPLLRMQLSGGKAFSTLRDKLDATLTVEYRGEQLPLSAVRGKAYDADPSVRRDAYLAELAAYPKLEEPMAACLNSIKAEAQTLAELKGYPDVLSMALAGSRVDEATLTSMWTAIREALPQLRGYLKAKARLLGHKNGLPFYDLFAPVGKSTRTYTIEEARDLLIPLFTAFCPDMGRMMQQAFDEGWIDVYPRAGKSGGAFCAGCYELDISRILTNFDGSLSDISTLAHELGHAFNNRMLRRVPIGMTDTPMPLAETASTFNETILSSAMRAKAAPQEELMLLDASLMENFQTMVDIYSRFLFEQKVCAAQEDHALSPQELCDTMLWAQDQSYGDGLNPAFRHPYMWACKSHYYSTGVHFYNFPYAFGSLFGRGLYARYQQEGASFVPLYCDLLSRFGSDTVANITRSVGIDVQTVDFWRSAVAGVIAEAERFAELVDRQLA